jgi:MFS family permease
MTQQTLLKCQNCDAPLPGGSIAGDRAECPHCGAVTLLGPAERSSEAVAEAGGQEGPKERAVPSGGAAGDGATTEGAVPGEKPKQCPLREIVQPFIDLVHAPRALWGVNVSYFLEGLCYFGVLGYLAMYFNQYVGLSDQWAGLMTMLLTAGITLSMALFGGLADRWGVRVALLGALALMIVGRAMLAGGPTAGFGAHGLWSTVHLLALGGMLLVVLGYGMYQPAAYAAVKQFTTAKTATMGYAMLYALMNLGGWIPTYFSSIRRAVGISGTYWIFTALTAIGLVVTMFILSRKVVERAIAEARAAREGEEGADGLKAQGSGLEKEGGRAEANEPFSVWRWLKNHPLADGKFAFFIFALIPVQTLFAHQWLTLPMYVARAYEGTWIGENFEVATNFNPLLIFVLVPMVAAVTGKRKTYPLMIVGSLVMASPTFLLALGPNPWMLGVYLLLSSLGEAIWQPRFLQYAAEIAPKGRTGAYIGVAQFPWFLTKVVTGLYSGWFLANYCPTEGPEDTPTMWWIYGCVAMLSTALLILARPWLAKDFKEKAA